MNVSMYTIYARSLREFDSPVSAFRHFREKGIRYADILSSELRGGLTFEEYNAELNEAGMTMGSYVDLHDIASPDEKMRTENRKTVRECIDKLERYGVKKLMLAPAVTLAKSTDDYKRMRELLIEGFADAAEYARGSDITVMIENQSVHTRADSRADDLLYILDSVPELYFVFDTGNFFCIGEDALRVYDLFRDRTVHAHVKDWSYDPLGSFVRPNLPAFEGVAIGDGLVPNRELISRFGESGFEGNLTLEVNSARTNFLTVERSADFLLKQTEKFR